MADSPLYRIPDLEWRQDEYGDWIGETPFGSFRIHSCFNGEVYWTFSVDEWRTGECESIESGKEQCNAHYRARMARGLVEVTQ